VNAGNGYGNMYYLPKHAKLSKVGIQRKLIKLVVDLMQNSIKLHEAQPFRGQRSQENIL
jgi:hypothetical protein